jgi:hypothetical protein
MGFTFDQWVAAIIAHREANPRFGLATDWEGVADELELFTALIVRKQRGTEPYFVVDPGEETPKASARPSSPVEVVGTVAGVGSKVLAGARIIIDWLGAGGHPVSPSIALKRAGICIDCPKHAESDWTTWATGKLASSIKSQLESKNQMALTTPVDAELKTCSACLCWLPLKIWCPIAHMTEYTTPQTKAEMDPRCWFLEEAGQSPDK